MTCLCGRDQAKRVGQPIEMGDIVGSGIEPGMRYGRVVGFVHDHVDLQPPKAARVIVREFKPGDGRWPTGEYVRAWLIVPWSHDHPTEQLPPHAETCITGDLFPLGAR